MERKRGRDSVFSYFLGVQFLWGDLESSYCEVTGSAVTVR